MTKIVIITGNVDKAEEIGMDFLDEAQTANGYQRGRNIKPTPEQLDRYMKNGISNSPAFIDQAVKRFNSGDDYGTVVWTVPEGIEVVYIDADKDIA